METIKVAKGKQFIQKGEHIKNLCIVVQGSVEMTYRTDSWRLEPGHVIGLVSCNHETHFCDYTAVDDCVLYAFDYGDPADFARIFEEDNKYISVFVMSSMRWTSFMLRRFVEYDQKARGYYSFLMNAYQAYEQFCKKYPYEHRRFNKIEFALPFVPKERVSRCMVDFYEKMAAMGVKNTEHFVKKDAALGVGEILNSVGWMQKAMNLIEDIREHLQQQKDILLDEGEDNLYHSYFELLRKAASKGANVEPLREKLDGIRKYCEDSGLYPKQWMDELFKKYESSAAAENMAAEQEGQSDEDIEDESVSYLDRILRYADYEEKAAGAFRQDVESLKEVKDPYSTDDAVRQLRRRLTTRYYEIYIQVCRKALTKKKIPNSVKMFLDFGFVDEKLVGEGVAKSLGTIAEKLSYEHNSNVYTMFEWLMSIYNGENEPSRNEFDLDYTGYLNDQKKSGRINAEQVKHFAQDNWSKVQFEIENMFAANNKLTYGKISSFCPLLCKHDVINSVENMLVTEEKINQSLDYIRSVDFSIFYRKVVFSDPDRDINMEMIEKEVLPIVILMPNAGSRAMMWQETSGIRRDTQARFTFPILTVGSVMEMMIEVAGRYRWEICRKIQGARWNDVTEPSLTSEYSDYIQYYRKNHELSADAKEKIKNILAKSKNNFREVFVKDYQNWVNYESKGSFRLNKVSRMILFKYCPFAKAIRQGLKINPMYQEAFTKFDVANDRAVRRLNGLYERYQKKGGEITKDLAENRNFYYL